MTDALACLATIKNETPWRELAMIGHTGGGPQNDIELTIRRGGRGKLVDRRRTALKQKVDHCIAQEHISCGGRAAETFARQSSHGCSLEIATGLGFMASMWLVAKRIIVISFLAAGVPAAPALAQDDSRNLPGLTEFAAPQTQSPLAQAKASQVVLAAQLTKDAPEIPGGLTWRVFSPEPGPDGKLPLVATAKGGTSAFSLAPGSYLVHAAYGRAGATKRITVAGEAKHESLVLDAGGLKLDAVLPGDIRIPEKQLRFSIYEAEPDATGERPLIVPDVRPNAIVRLNAGTYHVVSNYGPIAVIRSDIRVEAGQLTEATVEHRAAEMTLKLVRETGGEAIADTAWSILTETGEIVLDTVGAYASIVLPEGDYTIVAKNRERIYQRDFTVTPGQKQDVELLPEDLIPPDEEFTD
jgi:hypothetical protein